MQDIFETFEDHGTTYEQAVDKLSEYFKPKKSISYESHVHHKRKQSTDETIDNYYVRLSKLALSCEFSDKNEIIRDQVVNSCNSSKLRKKLLEEDNLTLEKVQQTSRTYELSETHSRRMEVPAESSSTNGTSN